MHSLIFGRLFTYMLKVGIFGVGHLGKFHLSNWQQIEGVELVGFYDPSDKSAQEVSDKFQLARFIEPDTLMNVVDAVDIVAPTTFHFDAKIAEGRMANEEIGFAILRLSVLQS